MKKMSIILTALLLIQIQTAYPNTTAQSENSNISQKANSFKEEVFALVKEAKAEENKKRHSFLKGTLTGVVALAAAINAGLRYLDGVAILQGNDDADALQETDKRTCLIYFSNALISSFIATKAFKSSLKYF